MESLRRAGLQANKTRTELVEPEPSQKFKMTRRFKWAEGAPGTTAAPFSVQRAKRAVIWAGPSSSPLETTVSPDDNYKSAPRPVIKRQEAKSSCGRAGRRRPAAPLLEPGLGRPEALVAAPLEWCLITICLLGIGLHGRCQVEGEFRECVAGMGQPQSETATGAGGQRALHAASPSSVYANAAVLGRLNSIHNTQPGA
jgi:hypothetical protein